MEPEVVVLLVLAGSSFCAAVGGCVSYVKHRPPLKGCLRGALLGPIGVALESLRPYEHRPMIDRPGRASFRTLVEHQTDLNLLQLIAPDDRSRPATRSRRAVG